MGVPRTISWESPEVGTALPELRRVDDDDRRRGPACAWLTLVRGEPLIFGSGSALPRVGGAIDTIGRQGSSNGHDVSYQHDDLARRRGIPTITTTITVFIISIPSV
jgi:hypothetical protein